MMNRLAFFRLLLVLFVLCSVAAFRYQGVDYEHSSSTLRGYQELLDARFGGFREGEWRWFQLWLAGHLVEAVGLVLLFCRLRAGTWPACLGAALAAGATWSVTLPDFYPNLQTTTDGLLRSATCVLWGGYVCMALTDQRHLFARTVKS